MEYARPSPWMDNIGMDIGCARVQAILFTFCTVQYSSTNTDRARVATHAIERDCCHTLSGSRVGPHGVLPVMLAGSRVPRHYKEHSAIQHPILSSPLYMRTSLIHLTKPHYVAYCLATLASSLSLIAIVRFCGSMSACLAGTVMASTPCS